MSSKLDYQIAKDYMLKLPEVERESLCKLVLKGLQERKKTRKEIDAEYSQFLKKSKSFQDFKRKYELDK
ncbi:MULTISPECIES: hypothetical protein [Chryseobacterium]|uniref:Uncharacterized protein n=1 Tax=Chryseobacterium geocarposphaerae TaxID=1416776 RepID=A0ABU1LCX3_9FLAO|nr:MULTISPECIES: hypothetical protein [Chryseobacterium]MDR6404573.1 hypothetical protein [Chryseobacterium geocarposphaerae]MDR6698195.1 hypothetical protein [Chryseobacterium ginsenosidimutans]